MDGAMFDHRCTVVPNWVRDNVFDVKERFPHASKDHPESAASIVVHHGGGKKTVHSGHVTTSQRGELPDVMRLYFGDDVIAWITSAFNKTFLRNEERKVRGMNGPTIERVLPFWEFIDIEWDAESSAFHFRAWYTQGDFTENIPGEPLEDESGTVPPTTMAECVALAIECMNLDKEGSARGFKWYKAPDGKIIHLKYSKYYDRHMNYWYGVTPESIIKSKDNAITHFGFIVGNSGCVLVTLDTLLKYISMAKTSDNEDGSTRHFHFFINSESPPVPYHYDSNQRFKSTFVEFDHSGSSGATSSGPSDPPSPPKNQYPDWLTNILDNIEDSS